MFPLLRRIFICFVFFITASVSLAENTYLAGLIKQAENKNLAFHDEWLRLVHYNENSIFPGYTSAVISRGFFNSTTGYDDPQAELNATLKSFFSTQEETDKTQNPQCRFIARYHWLDRKLNFDNKRLAKQKCARYEKWYETINPDQITMVFPAGTDNSPSSMFGHTLIRIDKKEQDERTRLFSYAINFAAETDETNGIVFAFKGIFGGYPGRFSIMPYYEKVNQYNQMENRDVWEYQLNFTKQEINTLLQHAWELGQIDFEYYFFLENCSFRLLELFDIARPGHRLADEFDVYAIPGDTVRVALEEQGFLKKAIYRPSERSRIKHYIRHLDENELALVQQIVDGEIRTDDQTLQDLAGEKRSLILDTSYTLLQYKLNSNELDSKLVSKRSYQVLLALNKLDKRYPTPTPPEPAVRLDEGHKTSRLAVGGLHRHDQDYLQIQYRPAYHDLLDLDEGYTKNAQINFFNFDVIHNLDTDKTDLNKLTLIDIFSLAPRDEFFSPLSWKFTTGFERLPIDHTGYDRMVYTINGGAGPTFALSDSVSFFSLAEMTLLFQNDLKDNYAVGAGLNLGLYWNAGRYSRTLLNLRNQRYSDHLDLSYVDYNLEQSFTLTTNTALRIRYSERGPHKDRRHEVSANLHWYF